MKREMFHCICCGRYLPCDPRSRNQSYCGRKKCQQARKNKWQRQKMECDPDYRLGKQDCQKTWREKNKGYMKKYRREHPAYELNNLLKQRERDRRRSSSTSTQALPAADLVKKDALSSFFDDNSASYFLTPADASLVKKDAIIVKIVPVSPG